MTEKKYQQEMGRIRELNKQKEFRLNIKKERNKFKSIHKIETSKLLAIYLLTLLTAIIIYAMAAMWRFADLSYLGVLISDIAAQILIYGIYCMKAYKSKKSEEDLKFKRECSMDELLKTGAESKEPVPTTTGSVELFDNETSLEGM